MHRNTPVAFMVSLSNHEGFAGAAVPRFMVRQAHHEATPTSSQASK
jgi:hypothetical protein